MSGETSTEDEMASVGGSYFGRFSRPTFDHLWLLSNRYLFLSERHRHVVSVHAELVRIVGERRFRVHSRHVFQMALAERDKVVIDAASWVEGILNKTGLLNRYLVDDNLSTALRLAWGPSENVEYEGRRAAYQRLFPEAFEAGRYAPDVSDRAALCMAIRKRFDRLLRDRSQHRAHIYERHDLGAPRMLAPAEVSTHLGAMHELLADLHCLSAMCDYPANDTRADGDDVEARDVVDLILRGNLAWFIDGGVEALKMPTVARYRARRESHYEKCRADLGAKAGSNEDPFDASC